MILNNQKTIVREGLLLIPTARALVYSETGDVLQHQAGTAYVTISPNVINLALYSFRWDLITLECLCVLEPKWLLFTDTVSFLTCFYYRTRIMLQEGRISRYSFCTSMLSKISPPPPTHTLFARGQSFHWFSFIGTLRWEQRQTMRNTNNTLK